MTDTEVILQNCRLSASQVNSMTHASKPTPRRRGPPKGQGGRPRVYHPRQVSAALNWIEAQPPKIGLINRAARLYGIPSDLLSHYRRNNAAKALLEQATNHAKA